MQEDREKKIAPLKRVRLLLEAGNQAEQVQRFENPREFSFIFGVGREGLTPFEFELADKTVGDELLMTIKPESLAKTFEHLEVELPGGQSPFYLKTRVQAVEPVSHREIIQAMAQVAGDCGCGCGGHGPAGHHQSCGQVLPGPGCDCGHPH